MEKKTKKEIEHLFKELEENADFECNVCGETHEQANGMVIERGDVPVLACLNCSEDYFAYVREAIVI